MPRKETPKILHKIKIKKDDQVKVIAGRDRGKTGRVIEVDRQKGKVLVPLQKIDNQHVFLPLLEQKVGFAGDD